LAEAAGIGASPLEPAGKVRRREISRKAEVGGRRSVNKRPNPTEPLCDRPPPGVFYLDVRVPSSQKGGTKIVDEVIELQKRGVFLDGFRIAAADLQHGPAAEGTSFSGLDFVKVGLGFDYGVLQGLWAGLADIVQTAKDALTKKFWVELYKSVKGVLFEPAHRYELGKTTAAMIYQQIAELQAATPWEYGRKLGEMFGMLVFEVAAGFVTAGAKTALSSLKAAKLLSKVPGLDRLTRRIASSSLLRLGINIGTNIAKRADAVLTRVRDIVVRVRKALPDLTNDAKLSRHTDGIDVDTDAIVASADQKFITRKLDEIETDDEKLSLALKRTPPDDELVERLSDNIERNGDELEDLLVSQDAAKRRPDGTLGSKEHTPSPQALKTMERGRDIDMVADLPPEVFKEELRFVANTKPTRINIKDGTFVFDKQWELPNSHLHRRDSDRNSLCRLSGFDESNCIDLDTDDPSYEFKVLADAGPIRIPPGKSGADAAKNLSLDYGNHPYMSRQAAQYLYRARGTALQKADFYDALLGKINGFYRERNLRKGRHAEFRDGAWNTVEGEHWIFTGKTGHVMVVHQDGSIWYGHEDKGALNWNNFPPTANFGPPGLRRMDDEAPLGL